MAPPDPHSIDAGTMAVIELTAQRTAKAVVAEHHAGCRIGDIVLDMWGQGDVPGVKQDVRDLKIQVSSISSDRKEKKGWLGGVLKSVVSAAVLFLLAWFLQMYSAHASQNDIPSTPPAKVSK